MEPLNDLGHALDPHDVRRGFGKLLGQLGLRPSHAATIGRYRLEQLIGWGSHGRVFRAWDPTLERDVALKAITVAQDRAADVTAEVRHEARVLAGLSHPGIVEVFDAFSHIGAPTLVTRTTSDVAIVMEFVPGQTLRDWAARSLPPTEAIIAAYAQAGRALAVAHEGGIVHRDFKPSNAMRRPDGRVVVLDFGVAAALAAADGAAPSPAGTPAYMAPEQHDGAPATSASDVYAFGCSLYEALSGRRPFTGANLIALQHSKLTEDPPRVRGAMPRRIHTALLRALSADPARRWPSMREFVAALRPRQRRPVVVAVMAGVIAGAAALVFASTEDPSVPCDAGAIELSRDFAPMRDDIDAAHAALGIEEDVRAGFLGAADDYTAAWRGAYLDSCAAASEPGGVGDRRRACLDATRRTVVAQLHGALAGVRPASELRLDLWPRLEECEDTELLRSEPLPTDPNLRARVRELEAWVRSVKAGEELEGPAEPWLRLAESVGHAPTLARSRAAAAELAVLRGDEASQRRHLEAAYVSAVQGRADRSALLAAGDLCRIALSLDDARRWARAASAHADSLGGTSADRSSAHTNFAVTLVRYGHVDDALREIESPLQWCLLQPLHSRTAAFTLLEILKIAVLADADTRVARIATDLQGRLTAHFHGEPELRADATVTIAVAHRSLGDLPRAEAMLVSALEDSATPNRWRRLGGLNLAQVLAEQGRPTDALDLLDGLSSDTDAERGDLLSARGHILAEVGRREEAKAAYGAADRAYAPQLPPEHPRRLKVAEGLAGLESPDRGQ